MNKIRLRIFFIVLLFPCLLRGGPTDLWVNSQRLKAIKTLLRNISPEGARRGVVIASPTPLYFKHWIRDSAIVMNIVTSLYENATTTIEKESYRGMLVDWILFSHEIQGKLKFRLGEALVRADGTVADGVLWGVPQHDGPALQAITLARLGRLFIKEGQEAFVKKWIYDAKIPAETLLKVDAEHTLHARGQSYCPWEEEFGDIFYVKMVQRKALIVSAAFARDMKDGGAADAYLARAKELEAEITAFWNPNTLRLECMQNLNGGVALDKGGLDSSVILGVMHGDTDDGFFPVYDDRVLSTAIQLEHMFRLEYSINDPARGFPGTAMGRNKADPWDGYYRTGEGHPWVLITYAFSEYYSRVAKGLMTQKQIVINPTNALFFADLMPNELTKMGPGTVVHRGTTLFNGIIRALEFKSDSFLARVAEHSKEDGGFSELIDRHNGSPRGVKNLTWSCASAIVAFWERDYRANRD